MVFPSLRTFFTVRRGGSLGTRLAKQQLQSRELHSSVHVFVTVIYPLSSVFVYFLRDKFLHLVAFAKIF